MPLNVIFKTESCFYFASPKPENQKLRHIVIHHHCLSFQELFLTFTRRLPHIPFLIAVSLICLILLTGYSLKGFYVRYLQDDYCYGAEVKRLGFWSAQINSYFTPMPYNSNRYALTLFSGIAEVLGGPYFSPFLPFLSILGWVSALVFTLTQWNPPKTRSHLFIFWSISLFLVFFFLYLAPNLYQVLYWRSGSFPYLTPMIFNTFLLGICLRTSRQEGLKWQSGLGLSALSFLSAGFSETAASWQLAFFGLFLILGLMKIPPWSKVLHALLWIISGTLLAVLILGICPANAQRIQSLNLQQPDFPTLIEKTLRFGYTYIRYALRIHLLEFSVIAIFGFFLGWVNPIDPPRPRVILIRSGLAAGLICYILVTAVTLPTMAVMSSPPDGRQLFLAQVSLISIVFYCGWISAQVVQSFEKISYYQPLTQLSLMATAIVIFAFLIMRLPDSYSDISAYRNRAHYWDLRHQMILEAVQAGEQDLVIPAFDSIQQVAELRQEAEYWVNTCAARYYQVHSLTAVEGYRGFPAMFK